MQVPGTAADRRDELWYGEVLAGIYDLAPDDRQGLRDLSRQNGLEYPDSVLTLIRVSTAQAVAAALRYVLAQPDPTTGERVHGGAVVDEILTRQSWLAP